MVDFPIVPDVPGVPPLLRDSTQDFGQTIDLLTFDTVIGYGTEHTPQWGLYLGGVPVIVADTVVSFEFKREWAIADYPVERGGFESYDKVNIPFQPRLQFASGGSEQNRQDLLDQISAIAGTLQLFDAVTPEVVYPSVCVQHYDYRRSARNGLGLLVIDLWLLEVRVTAGTTGENTKDASGASPSQDGNVQPSADVAPTQQSVDSFATASAQPIPFTGGSTPASPFPTPINAGDLTVQ